MKKGLLLGIAAIMMTACQKDDELTIPKEPFTITASMSQGAETRLGYEEVGRNLKVTWAVGDQITINGITSLELTADQAGETTATFSFLMPPSSGTASFGGAHKSAPQVNGQTQTADDSKDHLSGYHYMTGSYNAVNQNISFEHQTSVMRIALSGLRKDLDLRSLTLMSGDDGGTYTLNLPTQKATTGEFIAWLAVSPDVLNGENKLVFQVTYTDGGGSVYQSYTADFASGVNIASGKLLHCTINMNKDAEDAEKLRFLGWYNAGMATDFVLGSNIDLTGVTFTPKELPDGKTFDGGGHTVKGVSVSQSVGGLFGQNHGTIKNVIAQGASVTGEYIGAIAGYNSGSGIIVGCQAIDCTITTTRNGAAGGIVGETDGTVVACYERGSTISGSQGVLGGIAGLNYGGSIIACYASPASVVVRENVGVVVGACQSTYINRACYWQHDTLTKGVGNGTDNTTQSDYADCYLLLNTALSGTAAEDVVDWGENGLVY